MGTAQLRAAKKRDSEPSSLTPANPTGAEPDAEPAPKASPPDVIIRFISSKIGVGVFAGKQFRRGELIFHERAVLAATHDSFHAMSTRDAPEAYRSLLIHERALMHAAFPVLAGEEHVSPSSVYAILPRIGEKLRGAAAGAVSVEIEADQHAAMMARGGRWLWATARSDAARDARFLRWFAAYAFRLPDSKEKRQAAVFLIGSLINHACGGWNALFNIVGGELRILAKRDIEEGEEITINYGGFAKRSFRCRCHQCGRAPQPRRASVGDASRSSFLRYAFSKLKANLHRGTALSGGGSRKDCRAPKPIQVATRRHSWVEDVSAHGL